ncbi:MAG: serine/threonine protein kinase, partial [Thermoanaerobaculia bacterium]
MSSVDPFSNGSTVLHYRIASRAGTSVWRAEDVRTGKDVALKMLTRQLPKDSARRESTVREVRLAAAIHHTFIVPILEIATAGDSLVMIMEWVDGQSITKRLGGKPLDKTAFFRLAYQLAEAMKVLHGKGIIHGNINGDSVIVTAAGQLRLGGLNLLNLLQKKDGAAVVYQQKGSDVRSVSYMAPEQIAKGPVDVHTDIFAAGVVMYEMATGRLPYQGGSATEIARTIVEGQPVSPKTSNPNIDTGVLTVLGRSLFKDPFKRYKEARLMADDIAKFDVTAAAFANELTTKVAASAAPKGAAERHSILFVADLANYDELSASDPRAATRAAARVQQVIGEAVYLFDGQIVDPFGPLVVAELPTVENALEAARKGEFDFSPAQQGETPLPVRLLLHAGNVETRDGSVIGPAVSQAAEILAKIEPYKLRISEAFLKEGKPNVRLKDGGAVAGVKLYTIG